MPIPPAHPAAALLLKRFCPKYLDFAALAIGCILPDVAYTLDDINKFSTTYLSLFGDAVVNSQWVQDKWDWDDFSHTLPGLFIFCLPVGLLLLWVFFSLRKAWVANLPNPHREALVPLCNRPLSSGISYVVSLLLGAWLHIAWDSISNGDRWLGQSWPLLHHHAFQFGDKNFKVFRVIWMISSVGGVLALIIAYLRFMRGKRIWSIERDDLRPYLLWIVAGIVSLGVGFYITHHHYIHFSDDAPQFFHRITGFTIATFCCCVIVIGCYTRSTGQAAAIRPNLR